jgi:hypothetical protein
LYGHFQNWCTLININNTSPLALVKLTKPVLLNLSIRTKEGGREGGKAMLAFNTIRKSISNIIIVTKYLLNLLPPIAFPYSINLLDFVIWLLKINLLFIGSKLFLIHEFMENIKIKKKLIYFYKRTWKFWFYWRALWLLAKFVSRQNKGIKLFSQNLICTYNVIVRAFDKSNIYTV